MEPGHRRARRRKCKPPRYPAHCSARSPLFQWLSESCAASRSLVLSTYQSVSGGQACPYMSPCRLPFQRTSVTNTRAASKERAEFFSCAFTASSDILLFVDYCYWPPPGDLLSDGAAACGAPLS